MTREQALADAARALSEAYPDRWQDVLSSISAPDITMLIDLDALRGERMDIPTIRMIDGGDPNQRIRIFLQRQEGHGSSIVAAVLDLSAEAAKVVASLLGTQPFTRARPPRSFRCNVCHRVTVPATEYPKTAEDTHAALTGEPETGICSRCMREFADRNS